MHAIHNYLILGLPKSDTLVKANMANIKVQDLVPTAENEQFQKYELTDHDGYH